MQNDIFICTRGAARDRPGRVRGSSARQVYSCTKHTVSACVEWLVGGQKEEYGLSHRLGGRHINPAAVTVSVQAGRERLGPPDRALTLFVPDPQQSWCRPGCPARGSEGHLCRKRCRSGRGGRSLLQRRHRTGWGAYHGKRDKSKTTEVD